MATGRDIYDAGKPLHVTEITRLAKQVHDVNMDRYSIVSAILIKVKAASFISRFTLFCVLYDIGLKAGY